MFLGKVRLLEKYDSGDFFVLRFERPDCGLVKPGQFFQIAVGHSKDHLLKRPFSVLGVSDDRLDFYIKRIGDGTEKIVSLNPGDDVQMIGPLGNAFNIDGFKKVVCAGGGIGVAPLIFLMNVITKMTDVYSFIGMNSKSDLEPIEKKHWPIGIAHQIATLDGTAGIHGFVDGALDSFLETLDGLSETLICACGPMPFLKAVYKVGVKQQISMQFSMESFMGCGLGICASCACEDQTGNYQLVCQKGPVFNAEELVL